MMLPVYRSLISKSKALFKFYKRQDCIILFNGLIRVFILSLVALEEEEAAKKTK